MNIELVVITLDMVVVVVVMNTELLVITLDKVEVVVVSLLSMRSIMR